jgi:hypothetical protein
MSAIDFFYWETAGYTIGRLPRGLPHDHGWTPVETLISATSDKWTNPSSGGLWGKQIVEALAVRLELSPESAGRRWRYWRAHYPEKFTFVREAWGLQSTHTQSLTDIVQVIEAHVAKVHVQQLPAASRLFRVVGSGKPDEI